MLDNIINKNIIFLQNRSVKINSENDKALYKYGLEILYYYIIDIFVIFSLAYCFGKVYETAIMTFIFGVLQVFNGGYHAKTPLKCLLTMIIGAAAGNILIILMAEWTAVSIMLAIVLSIVITVLPPVINKRHRISSKVRQRSRMIMRIFMLVLGLTIAILSYMGRNTEVFAIAVTFSLYMVSWGIPKIKDTMKGI